MGKLKRKIPEEWEDIIGNSSVTLICNSLGPFLTEPFRHLTMYHQHICEEIREGRAVIFRPHPLLRTTMKSMMPGMEQDYDAFIAWAREQDGVIIDESEYLERALGIADRMISDMSSVIPMWQETGKPLEVMG